MHRETDVLVVGAGPTGLLLAAELALAGVRTLVVERRSEPQPNSRALNLHPRSLEILDQRGLADRFLAQGRTVPGWQFAATLTTPLDFSVLNSAHPHALLLSQARTEAILEQRAAELGAEICREQTVTDLWQDAGGISAEVAGPDGHTTVRAEFAVGCDGARSLVRRAAGIAFPGTRETFTAMVGDFADADHSDLQRPRRHGVLVSRLERGLTRFVVMDPARMRTPSAEPVTLEEFRTALLRACGTDCGVARPRWLSRFGNATRLAERYRSGRLLLAGDAAHIHFPVGAQGLNTGLQDAMNLGWKLAAEVQGWAAPGLLDTYHSERHPVGKEVTARTEAQALLVELPQVEQYRRPAQLLCELLDTLLGLDQVNQYLAGLLSALDTAYPPQDPAAHPLTGRRIPDISLTLPADGRRTRVPSLLHAGSMLLLSLADAPDASPCPPSPAGRPLLVRAVTVTAHGDEDALQGVTEVLVRPDGHVAWATQTKDPRELHAERTHALNSWIHTAQ